jgi:hypothetical protein
VFHNGASKTAVLKASFVGEELSAVLTVISGGIKSALQSVDMSLRTVFLLFSFSISAAVVDRVAVVVDNKVITESEVLEEVRLTEFIERRPVDLGPSQRRAAAERLVDQQLIRNEMEIGEYSQPSASEAEAAIQRFRQEQFNTLAQYRATLARYGITEDELKRHLLWRLTIIRFTNTRFPSQIPATTVPGVNPPRSVAAASANNSLDGQLDAWLKEARGNAHIVLNPGAFQ